MNKLTITYLSAGLLFLSPAAWSASGQAHLKGTTEGSDISGTITLKDTKAGLEVEANLKNVPPGDHGFHIHEFGGCGEIGKAAGGHFNPKGKKHGLVVKDGLGKSHVGDLGNITIDAKGSGTLKRVIKGVSLQKGKTSVAGRAFILHAKPDDFGQPTGNAGGRIACGPIFLVKE